MLPGFQLTASYLCQNLSFAPMWGIEISRDHPIISNPLKMFTVQGLGSNGMSLRDHFQRMVSKNFNEAVWPLFRHKNFLLSINCSMSRVLVTSYFFPYRESTFLCLMYVTTHAVMTSLEIVNCKKFDKNCATILMEAEKSFY